MTTAEKATEKAEAIAKLRELLPPGSTVYTILRHVSRSGMSRSISVVVQDSDGPRDIDYLVRRALDMTYDRNHGGVKVGGCGMDMGFHLVYELASRLYHPHGFECTGKGCPSNDHSNYPPAPYVAGSMVHKEAGYALRHRWL